MIEPHKVISQLSPNDALATIKALAREDEALAARIAEIAIMRLREIDPEDVAFDLYEELNALEVEEVWDRVGLYKFEHESTSEFKDWAVDAPGGFAWVVVDAWKAGAPSQTDVKALKIFIEEALGGWCAHLV